MHWLVDLTRSRPLTFGVMLLVGACSSGGGARPSPGAAPAAAPSDPGGAQVGSGARRVAPQSDAVALYRKHGLLAEGGETPFVGSLTFYAGRTPDTTLMVVTVSMPNRSLRFSREGDRYRAGYRVGVDVKRGTETVRSVTTEETVRVLAFRETQRTDESVLFRRTVALAPGSYEFRLAVRGDSVTSGSAIEASVGVPRFAAGTLTPPVPFYEASPRVSRDSLPRVLPTPRATVTFGRDSMIPIYLEGYGDAADFPVHVEVRPEGGTAALWNINTTLARRGNLFSDVVQIPLQQLGVGVMMVRVHRPGGADTLTAPFFVAFGDDLPAATFTEMLDYLRYYVNGPRLQEMRNATPERRAALWAAFMRDSDPAPETPQHEGLRDYFARMAQANLRFREEGGPGWLTDRGRVFLALGTPDQIIQPNINDLSQRGRTEVWEYRLHRLTVVFVDQTGFGRWKMTLASEAEFESTARRVMVQ